MAGIQGETKQLNKHGMEVKNVCDLIWRPSIVVHTFKDFLLGQSKPNLILNTIRGGTIKCINNPGHMTKMAAMPIYDKILQKSSQEPLDRFQRNIACNIVD